MLNGALKALGRADDPIGRAMKIKLVLAIITISLIGISAPPSQATETTIEQLPAKLEAQFALSALPPAMRDQATVYLLDPKKGYQLFPTGNEWCDDHAGPKRQLGVGNPFYIIPIDGMALEAECKPVDHFSRIAIPTRGYDGASHWLLSVHALADLAHDASVLAHLSCPGHVSGCWPDETKDEVSIFIVL